MIMDDQDIINLFFVRDQEGLRLMADKYRGALMALARRILRDEGDAEEAVSDTWLAAWNAIPPARPEHLYAYLAKICRFSAFGLLDKAHAQKRTATVVSLSAELEGCLPVDFPDSRDLSEVLNDFLTGLPDEKRRIFLRRYWFGDELRDISRRYGISESKVKVTLFRLRSQLKAHLEKEDITV